MVTFSGVNLVETGRRIKHLRERSGLSVAFLSEQLYVSQQAIFKWQRGEALPTIDNSLVLSKLFGVHMEDLFVLEDDRSSFDSKNIKNIPQSVMHGLWDIVVNALFKSGNNRF